MPDVTSGLIQFTVVQDYGGENAFNVFHYRSADDSEPVSWAVLLNEFETKVQAVMAGVQSTVLSYVEIRARTVFGTLPDGLQVPFQTNGIVAGLSYTNFAASAIRLQGQTKETRPGQKRFGGLTEDVVQGNTFTAGHIANLELLATAMQTTLFTGITWNPVIYSKPTKTRATHFTNTIDAATVKTFISSQVSRKRD